VVTAEFSQQLGAELIRRGLTRRRRQLPQRFRQPGFGLWIYLAHFCQLDFLAVILLFNIARARCSRDATVPGEHSSAVAASA